MKIGDFVAERHGMPGPAAPRVPEDTDYGIILAIEGEHYLFYDPFRNLEYWVHGKYLLPVSLFGFTRTGYRLDDGSLVMHDVVEAVAFARRSGRFDRRERMSRGGVER